ncbi:hypothetical protein PAMP_006630 [Pampus punctatissimus]
MTKVTTERHNKELQLLTGFNQFRTRLAAIRSHSMSMVESTVATPQSSAQREPLDVIQVPCRTGPSLNAPVCCRPSAIVHLFKREGPLPAKPTVSGCRVLSTGSIQCQPPAP